jgi:hypothetical protein
MLNHGEFTSRSWYTSDITSINIWLFNIAMENSFEMEVLMGKSSINGQFYMAMLNNQRVTSN